jgi:hypothetical protein
MHSRILPLILSLAAVLSVVGRSSTAQQPGPQSYNASRAYLHFLTSPYSYRTYSSLSAPYTVANYAPHGYERFTLGSGYLHQRITPRGFESHYVAPAWAYSYAPYPPPVYSHLPVPVYAPAPWEPRPLLSPLSADFRDRGRSSIR